ncbi:MAG: N-acetylmuramoyl-L-alanine amidase [Campylobacterales bacterium]
MVNRFSFFRSFALILFFCISLFAANLDEIEKNLSSDKDSIRAYNSLKSAYINALISGNDEELIESLKLLSRYATDFGENPSKYTKELNELTVKEPKKPENKEISSPTTPKKPEVDTPKVSKPKVEKPAKMEQAKKEVKAEDKAKKEESRKVNKEPIKGTPKIVSINSQGSTLEIVYNSLIDESVLLKDFSLKGKPLKQVFDIKGELFSKNKNPKVEGFKKVVVGQNRDGVTRVVFYTDKRANIKKEIDQDRLRLFVGDEPSTKASSTTPPPAPPKKQNPLANKVVVLDPGHGGKDCGAQAHDKTCEKGLVLNLAKYTRDYLNDMGIKKVYLTRSTDKFIKLRDRTKFANDNNADVFVSIHLNSVIKSKAHKLKGVETYFLSHARSDRAKNVAAIENQDAIEDMDYFTKNTFLSILNSKRIVDSNKLSIDIQRGLVNQLDSYKVKDGGVREGPFWVLVGAQMPSVLVEGGYISNKEELKLIKKPSYQKKIAKGIAIGIINYLEKN